MELECFSESLVCE